MVMAVTLIRSPATSDRQPIITMHCDGLPMIYLIVGGVLFVGGFVFAYRNP
jgi:hypothetical protein